MYKAIYFAILIHLSLANQAPGKTGALMFELNHENFDDVIDEILEKPKETLPLFIVMLMGECTVGKCPTFMKDVHLVADIVKR